MLAGTVLRKQCECGCVEGITKPVRLIIYLISGKPRLCALSSLKGAIGPGEMYSRLHVFELMFAASQPLGSAVKHSRV